MIGPNWYYLAPKGDDALFLQHFGKKKFFEKSGFEPLNGHLKIYARGPAHGHNMPVACPSAFPREKGSGRGKIWAVKVWQAHKAHFRQRRAISAHHLSTGQFCPSHTPTGIFSDRHPHRRAKSACQIMTGLFCPSHTPTGIFCPSSTPTGQICPSNNDGPALPVKYTDGHILPVIHTDGPNLPVKKWRAYSARHIHRRAYSARHPHRRAKSACQIMTGLFCPSHTPTGIFNYKFII